MYHNQAMGRFGEDLAVKYLLKNHYQIIERNYRTSHREIDIVAKISNIFVFIEVKTRAKDSIEAAEFAMSQRKSGLVLGAISQYLYSHKIFGDNFRFDLIAVDICKKTKTAYIKHIIDIF